MSLLIKVMGTGGIMDVHKKAAEEKGYVWYSYEGNPAAKPYDREGLNDIYFVEQDKLYYAELSKIYKGPTHGGGPLDKNEIPYIPDEYRDYLLKNWNEYAFFLKCKNIKQIDYNKIENLYYEAGNKQYNPKIMAAAVYVNFMPSNFVYPTRRLVKQALDELGKKEVPKIELIEKMREIVEQEGKVLVDKGTALKEIDNLLWDIMKCQQT